MREPLLPQLHGGSCLRILDGLQRVLVAAQRIDAAEISKVHASSLTDAEAENGLALARHHLGQLAELYAHRYELIRATELLQRMNVPVLPPKDEPFPCEAAVRADIEKLRVQKDAEEGNDEAVDE